MSDQIDVQAIEREAMEYDVVIVGARPSGLAAAIRLKQINPDISVAVLEKGSEVGAHILSGAVVDPKGLTELIPDWRTRGAPLDTPVTKDRYVLLGENGELDLSWLPMPPNLSNHGAYVGSLGNLCRWLGTEAEALGVEIYPGMAASELVYAEDGAVKGVVAGVFGIAKDGHIKGEYQPGLELHGKYVFLGEGVRGNLAQAVQARFNLCEGASPQKYGIGLKELWQIPAEKHQPGLVQHSFGWPLGGSTGGGSFLYHFGDRYVSVGLVVHLNYKNPWLSPFDEFQRLKHHESFRSHLEGGTRIAYGARAISEGGYQSVPGLVFPGGALLGDSAGFVNLPRIKGSHNAVKTGMMAAEAAAAALAEGRGGDLLVEYQHAYNTSWVKQDLKLVRNVKVLWSRFGTFGAVVLGGIDLWITYLTRGWSPFGTLKHTGTDAEATGLAKDYEEIKYAKPDGKLSFDKLSSVYLSATNHEEDQPSHLKLKDPTIPIRVNLPLYGEPARLYCPAGVYEVIQDQGAEPRFVINAQNCVHCKTCDIKDPSQNIVWTTPEGGGGPNYPNM